MIESFSGEYRWLSNFWPVDLYFEGSWYSSVEHAYQAAKTIDIERRLVLTKDSGSLISKKPGLAKKHGRVLPIREDWDFIKIGVMRELLSKKFGRGSILSSKLLATGDMQITEGNSWGDTFWGKSNGIGHNYLGYLLMQIREELRSI